MSRASLTLTWITCTLLCLAGCESREPDEPIPAVVKPMAVTTTATPRTSSINESLPDDVPLTPTKPAAEVKAASGELTAPDAKLQVMITELDHKIAVLEKKISAPPQAPIGTGAYARGTTLRVAGDGSGESLLEKLRRLETELASASASVAAKNQTIANLNQQRDVAVANGRESSERADYLAHSSESLVAAQQTLAERQEQITALNSQLATGELQRLRAERRWYQLASEILRLSPDDARDLPGVQSRIRQATRDVRDVRDVRDESIPKP